MWHIPSLADTSLAFFVLLLIAVEQDCKSTLKVAVLAQQRTEPAPVPAEVTFRAVIAV